MNFLSDLVIPLPFWVAAFSVILGAIVTAVVAKTRTNRAIIAEAAEIKGASERPSLDEAKGIVGANRTLQRANEALQMCNLGLEKELALVKGDLADTARDLKEACLRIEELESAIRTWRETRARKTARVALANKDLM